ncbi:MAG: TlpA family protein disulfide reductase [Crocinitomicaceae bacterium]|nr:TlpA family protein disulfide reductase [Crocinitomicaceae bacterium]
MKKFILLLTIPMMFFSFRDEDKGKAIPNVTLKDVNGNEIKTGELSNDGKPMIINFWATWCSPCKRELEAISEVYDDWVEETGVVLYAVSIDDEKTKSRVKPYVDGKGWDYVILLDPNSDFRRALGVNNPPQTFLVNGEGKIVWTHNSYSPGDEDELHEKLVEISGK